ncbi:MAG: cyclase family protein [Paracoccaceae bacterium]
MSGYQCISSPLYVGNREPVPITVQEITHEAGAAILCQGFDIDASDWPDGYAISNEIVTLSTHQGTHIDAPLHYGPEGDAIPALDVNDFLGKAIIITDLSENGHVVDFDRKAYESKLDAFAGQANAVFFITGAWRRFGENSYFTQFKGIPVDMIELALERGYHLIGTDAFSVDPPFATMSKAFEDSHDPAELWPAHVLGRSRPYYQIERLHNMAAFETSDLIEYIALPVNLNCGAAWTRAVARHIQ